MSSEYKVLRSPNTRFLHFTALIYLTLIMLPSYYIKHCKILILLTLPYFQLYMQDNIKT